MTSLNLSDFMSQLRQTGQNCPLGFTWIFKAVEYVRSIAQDTQKLFNLVLSLWRERKVEIGLWLYYVLSQHQAHFSNTSEWWLVCKIMCVILLFVQNSVLFVSWMYFQIWCILMPFSVFIVKPTKMYTRGSVVMVDEMINSSPPNYRFPEAGLRVMITNRFGPKTRLRMASRLIINEVCSLQI